MNVLRRKGHEVVEALDGDDAWRIYTEMAFELVIADVVMPGMSGIELIRKIRQINPRAKIIATAAVSKLLCGAEEAGACAVLPKPFLIQDLQEMVEGLLEGDTSSGE